MSGNFENYLCYCCDETYTSCFIENYSIWICEGCTIVMPINNIEQNNIEQNGECCVCFEDKLLIKLPTCIHKVCFECCKNIYFGSTTIERPIHVEPPDWPYVLNDHDDNDHERIKYDEYCEYVNKYFDIGQNTYDELIEIRNSLILDRPSWMNTE